MRNAATVLAIIHDRGKRPAPASLERRPDRTRTAAPRRHLRTLRLAGARRGASCTGAQGPPGHGATRTTALGEADGRAPPQDPGGLPPVPHRHPPRTPGATPGQGMRLPESRMRGNVPVRFGGGPSEKYQPQGWQLAGGLPYPASGLNGGACGVPHLIIPPPPAPRCRPAYPSKEAASPRIVMGAPPPGPAPLNQSANGIYMPDAQNNAVFIRALVWYRMPAPRGT